MHLRRLGLAAFLLGIGTAVAATEREIIPLWPEGVPDARPELGDEYVESGRVYRVQVPTLTHFPAPSDRRTGAAFIICPGGGYQRLAVGKEGNAVADWLNSLGIECFVLKYRLKEYGHPAPLRDVLRAIRIVRSRAGEFGIRPDRIGVIGSSAGGHLASAAATLFDHPDGRTGHALDEVDARPDLCVLMYPVILMEGPAAHCGSRDALLGSAPTFLFHTGEDTSVPPENSAAFHAALHRHGVAAELHIYARGPHGAGLARQLGTASGWPAACSAWLHEHGWLGQK
jgi:acetyl esterase/lipase